jgi:thiamine biosynthesis lipoprotein
MSFFDEASDIGRLNAAPAGEAVSVSLETAELLRFAQELYTESGGAFDVMYEGRSRFPLAAIQTLSDRSVIRTEDVHVDLGGIAKGYAVDEAAALIAAETHVSAVINAGGDIRFVGNEEFPLTIRSPFEDGRYVDVGRFSNCAVATSVFQGTDQPVSISVVAPSCVLADSLTKVVFGMNKEGRDALLKKYDAHYITVDKQTIAQCEERIR